MSGLSAEGAKIESNGHEFKMDANRVAHQSVGRVVHHFLVGPVRQRAAKQDRWPVFKCLAPERFVRSTSMVSSFLAMLANYREIDRKIGDQFPSRRWHVSISELWVP